MWHTLRRGRRTRAELASRVKVSFGSQRKERPAFASLVTPSDRRGGDSERTDGRIADCERRHRAIRLRGGNAAFKKHAADAPFEDNRRPRRAIDFTRRRGVAARAARGRYLPELRIWLFDSAQQRAAVRAAASTRQQLGEVEETVTQKRFNS